MQKKMKLEALLDNTCTLKVNFVILCKFFPPGIYFFKVFFALRTLNHIFSCTFWMLWHFSKFFQHYFESLNVGHGTWRTLLDNTCSRARAREGNNFIFCVFWGSESTLGSSLAIFWKYFGCFGTFEKFFNIISNVCTLVTGLGERF